jgi:serine/threonine-protein kinase
MPAQVVVQIIRGKLRGKTYRFHKRTLCLIGRADDCQIRLPNDDEHCLVSRHHCLLDIDPPHVRVQDFGSRNGTYLNGAPIGRRPDAVAADDAGAGQFPECDVKHRDRIQVGQTILRICVQRPPVCALCGVEISLASLKGVVQVGRKKVCRTCREAVIAGVSVVPRPVKCIHCRHKVIVTGPAVDDEKVVCWNCREDPRHLVKGLLERADAGDHKLVGIQGYALLKQLGRRRESAVYLARHRDSGQRVALKVMFPRGAADCHTRIRFLREAQNTMVLRHPNIVQLLDAGWSNGIFFFTLEYCEKGTVAAFIKERGGRLTLEEAAPLVLQTLDGLEYSHNAEVPFVPHEDDWQPGRGLVHRDVKPSNLFLREIDGRLVAKLGDFGLSKAFDKAGLSGHTWSGILSGTPFYMPRQQVLRFKYARPEVDVWAMAATLYYMLTGTPPRDFSRGNGWMEVVLETSAVPIRERLPNLPPRVAQVIDDALIDNPEIRFKTAAGLRRALAEALGE